MGIDNDAELILGWQVDTKKASKWLQKRGAQSCDGDDQCFCGTGCWKVDNIGLPKGFVFVRCSPYYDCPNPRCNIMLRLELNSCEIQDMIARVNSVDWKEAEKFAHMLGGQGTAGIWAEPNVW